MKRAREEAGMGVRENQKTEGTGSSPTGVVASCPAGQIHGKARSWALSIGVPTKKLKNMQTSEFTQKFRHSWGITEMYFENTIRSLRSWFVSKQQPRPWDRGSLSGNHSYDCGSWRDACPL